MLFWISAAVVLAVVAPREDPTVGETTDLLPSDTPVHLALQQLADHFGDHSGLSNVVVVFERADGTLSAADLRDIESVANLIPKSNPDEKVDAELRSASIRSPATLSIAGNANPMISDDRRAALINVSLPFNFISKQAARVVKHIQAIVAQHARPAGLSAVVTGSAGYGYDYAIATERSHHKTLIVTLISVITILLAVYRAPFAAAVPLMAISMAAVVVFKILAIAQLIGLHGGTAEQIFTFVLLYGAGVDYSLLCMSRYREALEEGRLPADAITFALNASFGAIASSATMTVAGLLTLCFARFSVYRFAGPAVVLALVSAAIASVTLVPAMLGIIGPRTFWGGKGKPPINATAVIPPQRKFWPFVAGIVVRNPRVVMTITFAVLVIPAIRGSNLNWDYNSLSSLKMTYPARQGTELVSRHWPLGETAPVTVLTVADQPQSTAGWAAICDRMANAITALPNIGNVRSLTAPLGIHVTSTQTSLLRMMGGDKINSEYLSHDQRAMRLSVVLNQTPLTVTAMATVTDIAQVAQRAAASAGLHGRVMLTGATAEVIDMRQITQADFHRVSAMSLIAILIMITIVLRDVWLSVFILATTLLSYFTTLGITYWVFHLTGTSALEWKVQMLLFIVLIAVGQDYSIFFAMRFAQESRNLPCKEATQRAMIFTGPVISSCGLIMAATLGSVMAADISLLVQLGFAFVIGMLVDTFIVRPLLLPTFIILTNRTLRNAMMVG